MKLPRTLNLRAESIHERLKGHVEIIWFLRTTLGIGGIVFKIELRDAKSFPFSKMSQFKTRTQILAAVSLLTNLMALGDEGARARNENKIFASFDTNQYDILQPKPPRLLARRYEASHGKVMPLGCCGITYIFVS